MTAGLDTKPTSALASAVMAAMDTVRDPELDAPVTHLGFVSSCEVQDGTARVHLRLPTYFCAPNFAFLMVADAYDAVSAVPGVDQAEIVLDDHFAGDQINGGVAARAGLVESFGTELAGEELDTLRRDFIRKAVWAGADRVGRTLAAAGVDLATATLGDLPASHDLTRLRERRAELGLPAGDQDPFLVDVQTGQPIAREGVPLHMQRARLTRVGIEANTGICRGMLADRYKNTAGAGEMPEED